MPDFRNGAKVRMRVETGAEGAEIGKIDGREPEAVLLGEARDIGDCPAAEVVEADHAIAARKEGFHQRVGDKSRPAGHQNRHRRAIRPLNVAQSKPTRRLETAGSSTSRQNFFWPSSFGSARCLCRTYWASTCIID